VGKLLGSVSASPNFVNGKMGGCYRLGFVVYLLLSASCIMYCSFSDSRVHNRIFTSYASLRFGASRLNTSFGLLRPISSCCVFSLLWNIDFLRDWTVNAFAYGAVYEFAAWTSVSRGERYCEVRFSRRALVSIFIIRWLAKDRIYPERNGDETTMDT